MLSFDVLSRTSPRSPGSLPRSFVAVSVLPYPDYSGSGFIAGIAPGLVTVNAIPAARSLKLFTRHGGILTRMLRSAEDGSYRFDQLDENRIFQIIGQDDPFPPFYQAVARDFLVPVIPVTMLWRVATTARAICPHQYLKGTLIRILHADQVAWNADYVLSAVGSDWLEFAVDSALPANPTGSIVIQRRY